MTIEVWPFDSIPEMRSFRLRPYNISSIASQTQELIPGGLMVQRFEVKMTMPDMEEEKWRDHDGLFAELCGTAGRIRLWDCARPEPFYNQEIAATAETWAGGALWSDGSSWEGGKLPPYVAIGETARRGDNNILLAGFPASLSGVLRRGDLFEIRPNGIPADHGHCYVVTRRANSNADGMCRVYFRAGLRKGVRAGDQVVIGGGNDHPHSVFRLASDDEGSIDVHSAMFGSFGATFIEVLPHA